MTFAAPSPDVAQYLEVLEEGPKPFGAYVPDLQRLRRRGRVTRRGLNLDSRSDRASYRSGSPGRRERTGRRLNICCAGSGATASSAALSHAAQSLATSSRRY